MRSYLIYRLADGQAGVTTKDLRRSFYGQRDETLLAVTNDGGVWSNSGRRAPGGPGRQRGRRFGTNVLTLRLGERQQAYWIGYT